MMYQFVHGDSYISLKMFYSIPPLTITHIIVLISLFHTLEQIVIIIPSSHTLYISGTLFHLL